MQPLGTSVLEGDLARAHPADAIETLNAIGIDAATAALATLKPDAVAAIFNHPGLDRPAALISRLPPGRASEILLRLHNDRRVDIMRHLAPKVRRALCALLPPPVTADLTRLLVYAPHQAGGIMTTEYVSLPGMTTAAGALQHIRQVGSSKETIYAIYLAEPETGVLTGVVSLRELLMADPLSLLSRVAAGRTPITVRPEASSEEAARLISKYDLLAVPVVDATNRILGIVTVDDVIDTMIEANTDDVQMLGGVQALEQPYMSMGFGAMLRKRAGWLSVLFLSEMLTASAMQTTRANSKRRSFSRCSSRSS